MSNMSYCRFNNTELDLSDCLNALDVEENEYKISENEVKCGVRMFEEFLNYCEEQGIITEYNSDQIEAVFKNHNEEVKKV